jgi:hypothetical protein
MNPYLTFKGQCETAFNILRDRSSAVKSWR